MSSYHTIKERKKLLRAEILAKRRAIDPARKAQMDEKIVTAFTSLVSYRFADIILLYYPRKDEIDVRPILSAALKAGKKVALPRTRDGGQMDFHFVDSESRLVPGAFRIPEPDGDCPIFDPETAEKGVLMLLPGLAFDRSGYWLGYGKGYYDRYLENRSITTAGLVYSEFLVPDLPRGRFDLPVHFIVTEKGVTFVE